MDPISMLKAFFPTSAERYTNSLPGAASTIPRATDFGPSVILGGALRVPDHIKKSGIDPILLAQYGGGGGTAQANNLKKLTEFWGAMTGGKESHAVARYGQSVNVGDNSVVETKGGGSATAGANSTVTATGDMDANIRIGNKSTAMGADGDDSIVGGDSAAVRGGRGDDFVMVKDGSIVSGDSGNDNITAGRYSIVDGGTGNDILRAGAGSTIVGGDGSDSITVERSTTDTNSYDPAKINGGTGNDTIRVTNTSADIEYRRGDGSDIIQGDLGTSMLKLVDLRESDVTFEKVVTGAGTTDLLVKVAGSTDTITIKSADVGTNGNFSIALRGGSEKLVSEILAGL